MKGTPNADFADMFVLVCSIKWSVSNGPNGWPHDHGFAFQAKGHGKKEKKLFTNVIYRYCFSRPFYTIHLIGLPMREASIKKPITTVVVVKA